MERGLNGLMWDKDLLVELLDSHFDYFSVFEPRSRTGPLGYCVVCYFISSNISVTYYKDVGLSTQMQDWKYKDHLSPKLRKAYSECLKQLNGE